MSEEECQCMRCTLVQAVIELIDEDDDGEPGDPMPMTRARAEFMKMLIDRQEPAKRRETARIAIQINDKVMGTKEELPIDIADHFRAIVAGKAVTDAHPLEDIDPPVNSKWGRR